jgi:N-acetylglucosaminyldiphosphoundecaprenol N-acetyl-beta-D-mannosaminyltransferase
MTLLKNNIIVDFFNIKIHSLTYQEVVNYIEKFIQSKKAHRIVLLHPHLFLVARVFPEYMEYIKNSDLVLADGIGIVIGSLILNGKLIRRVVGTDLMPVLAKVGAEKGWKFYFLGAKPGVAESAYQNLKKMYPNFNVVGFHHGYYSEDKEELVVKDIKEKSPDILIVCFGAYKQEMFIKKYQEEIGVPVAFGNGAAFDFWSGKVKRAPKWLRSIGFEWFWRLIQEPKRLWKRYIIGNAIFILLIFKELIRKLIRSY